MEGREKVKDGKRPEDKTSGHPPSLRVCSSALSRARKLVIYKGDGYNKLIRYVQSRNWKLSLRRTSIDSIVAPTMHGDSVESVSTTINCSPQAILASHIGSTMLDATLTTDRSLDTVG